MKKNEFTMELPNKLKNSICSLALLCLLFIILLSYNLSLSIKRSMYTEEDVQQVNGVLTDIIEDDDNIFDLIINQKEYRLTFSMSNKIDKESLISNIDKEITIYYINDTCNFIVGIDSSLVKLAVEEGLEHFTYQPDIIVYSIIILILAVIGVCLFIKFIKLPKVSIVDQTEYHLFKQKLYSTYQKKIIKFMIIPLLLIFLLFILVIYLGSVDDTSITFYIIISLFCLNIVFICFTCPFLIKKLRKENIKESISSYNSTQANLSLNEPFEIYSNSIDATCIFEKEQFVVIFDYDFTFQSQLDEDQRTYCFKYNELSFTTKALFRDNGTVNIAIETPIIIDNKQFYNPLILDINKKLIETIKCLDLDISGLNYLISNLDNMLKKYKGKNYLVSFDSTGTMKTRQLKFEEILFFKNN